MSLRSIAKIVGRRRDQAHDREWLLAALDRISRSTAQDGDQALDMLAIRQAAQTSAEPLNELTEEAVAQYLDVLSERERAMFQLCRDGLTASEIAHRMNMERKAVALSLARIYTNLRFLNRRNQPTKEAFMA